VVQAEKYPREQKHWEERAGYWKSLMTEVEGWKDHFGQESWIVLTAKGLMCPATRELIVYQGLGNLSEKQQLSS